MQTPRTITVTKYDYDTKETEVVVENLSMRLLAKAFTTPHLAGLLDDMLNSYNNQFKQGQEVGTLFLDTHHTIQGCFVNFLLGCLVGIAAEEYTDPRNEVAIRTAKEIKRLLESGELPTQRFI